MPVPVSLSHCRIAMRRMRHPEKRRGAKLAHLDVRPANREVAPLISHRENGHLRALLGKPYLAAVLDDAGALPQSDGFTRPSLASCLKGRLGYLKVLDARHMLEEGVAKLVPAIDPEGEMSASRHCA
jgi:hypothetical protein